MNTTEDRAMETAESIDHRLAVLKTELERIYQAQEELLQRVNPALREDFRMTRADRLRALTEEEKENHWLLKTWLSV